MRNLKRVLSLALAVMMLIGMMVVGANAAGINDFTDKDEIVNKDAVAMLTTLGVINGKEDGSFYAPKDNVTRAEMAKMIATILNQGADVNDLYANLNTGLKDIDNSWAKGYINYCYSLGIIAGRGDGRFDPTAPVTGNEAAKMLLVAIGYDPAIEGLTGSTWAIKTTALASTLGIFDGLTAPTQDNLNRDNAALVIYNALDVEMIQKYEDGYAITFSDSRTLLSTKYGVYKVEGVVVGNKWAELNKTDSDAALKDGKTVLDDVVLYSSTTSNTTVNEGVAQAGQISFNVNTPVEYLGKTVTMYIEKTTILSDSKVLGVSTKDNVNVIQASAATSSTVKDYLKGTGLTVTDATEFYVNYGYCQKETDAESIINNYIVGKTGDKFNLNGVEVEVIDNNNDGDVDYVLYTQETLSKVSRYSEKNETVSFYAPVYDKNGDLTNKTETETVDFEDAVFAGDVTADALILYVQYGGRTYISLPEIVTGTMSRVDRDKNDELFITVEGETYKQSYILDTASLIDIDIDRFDINDAKNNPGFSTEYDFILDSNGYVVDIRPAEEVVTNYALVLDSAWTKNALETKGQIEILKTDGTEATYYINWDRSLDKAFANETEMRDYLGTEDVLNGGLTGAAAGTVITYTLSDDDILTITSVLGENNLGADDAFVADATGNQKPSVSSGDMVYMEDNAAADHNFGTNVSPNMQYVLTDDYDNGDGYIDLNGNTYAVDKNTIAFYYDKVELADLIPVGKASNEYNVGDRVGGHVITNADQQKRVAGNGKYADTTYDVGDLYYGVATGWDKMSDVKTGASAQFYPVLKKTDSKTYEATKLAEVLLLNSAPYTDSANWLLVLTANAVTSKTLELNVVFEDGTTKGIQVDKDKYEDEFDKADGYAYMVAYTYSVNSDGTYELNLNSRTASTDAVLLKNGTLDVDNNKDNDYPYADVKYPTLVDKSNIWDVTDMSTSGDDAAKGQFVVGYEKNAVIITTNDDKVLQTAWIWDKDEDDTGIDGSNPVVTKVLEIDEDNFTITLQATKGAKDRQAAITAELKKYDYTDISYKAAAGVPNEYEVTATDRDGAARTFTTKTTWYDDEVKGVLTVGSAGNSANWPVNSILTDIGSVIEANSTIADIDDAHRHIIFTFKTTAASQNVVLKIVDNDGALAYSESYTFASAGMHSYYIDIDECTNNASGAPGNPRGGYLTRESGAIPSGNYGYTVTIGDKVVSSGEFTVA